MHHDITTSFVHNNTLFRYVYRNRYSVAIIEHKGEYHCTIYFKIAVVNIVLCIAVPYCCFIILYLSQVYLLHPNYYTVSILTPVFTINLSLLRALCYYTVSILTVCLFYWLTNTKVRYTVPPLRHIVCRLRIHSTLDCFNNHSHFIFLTNKHKGECDLNFD